jgi:hypothetical protein
MIKCSGLVIARINIGVIFPCEPFIGPFNLVDRSLTVHTKDQIEIHRRRLR